MSPLPCTISPPRCPDVDGDQPRRRGNDGVVTQRKHVNARGANAQLGNSRGGQHREIDRAQLLAGAAQRQLAVAIAARRQDPVAGSDDGKRFGAVAGLLSPRRTAPRSRSLPASAVPPRCAPARSATAPARSRRRRASSRRRAPSRRSAPALVAAARLPTTSAASTRCKASPGATLRGATGFTSRSISASTSASGVSLAIVGLVSETASMGWA